MADASEDPALLFSPVERASSIRSSDSTSQRQALRTPTPDASRRVNDTRLAIEIPTLSKDKLAKYQPLENVEPVSDSDEEDELKIEEIVGEYKLGNTLFLFARYSDKIIRRKEEKEFRICFPDIYDEYGAHFVMLDCHSSLTNGKVKKKEAGSLDKFDPSSLQVHPKHRISFVISLQKRKPDLAKDVEYVDASDASEDTEEDAGSDYDGETYVRRSTRASKRQAVKPIRALPFSPRKTRARKGGRKSPIEVDDEDASEEDLPQRRSSRNTNKNSYATHDDSDYDIETDRSNSPASSRSTRKAKQIVKRKGPKPAYGRIRNVEDLYDSDPDTAALRGHRNECEKCHRAPTHILLKKRGRKKKKKKDDDTDSEEGYFARLGGWVRCLKCCVAAHWACLARTQRAEIVKAARAKAEAESKEMDDDSSKMIDLDITETTEFICGSCSKGGICMICQEIAIEAEQKPSEPVSSNVASDERVIDDTSREAPSPEPHNSGRVLEPAQELLFRCVSCKRLAHYSHLPVEDEDDLTPTEVAQFYQDENKWQCGDCASYIFPLDKIIAWRPFPLNAIDRYSSSPEGANYRESLPREYLVKWVGRSFRRLQWVPHMWLVATHWSKLKNFYERGPRLDISSSPADRDTPAANEESLLGGLIDTNADPSRATSAEAEHSSTQGYAPPPSIIDAQARIPLAWKTIDRILDVLLWSPQKTKPQTGKKGKSSKKRTEDDDAESEVEATLEDQAEYDNALDLGEEPGKDVTETVDEFERRTGKKLGAEHISRVIWAFIKWSDLPYDEATWDSPPRPESFGYVAYQHAFNYYLRSREVIVRKKNAAEIAKFEDRRHWNSDKLGVSEDGKYDIGQGETLKLMPFQVQGVNWLCRNWFYHQQCILADEMGLGKTIQIVTFLGLLHARMGAFPSLVVVPNSTITNWVREFERWSPNLRVVPFYGEQKSRDIIKRYELQHPTIAPGTTGAKYHILVATYEAVTGSRDFNPVFRNNPRWEVLVVDEGQRLKSDSSLIFKRLNELNSCHRIIMTGTPINNNVRELFNLMNFLNPNDWRDLEALTKEFEELDEDRVKELHERLRPYFLRRVKGEVLDLPAKNEVIVPISMAPLQKEIYKSILSKNLAILSSLRVASSSRLNKAAVKSTNMRNMLMQLRKCLQHPYLVADDIEPQDLTPQEAHFKLIDASGKLRFLKMLLPKLKARAHRILLFSQFVIALDIIEDFLEGEGYKFLRLDGNTKQAERQKDMDEFNKENSDVFIYMLSTRAGGVGINLWSADTVIIFDPDFNPHQDLQAIARAHRYGQKKTCLVFKFMTKPSAEEKIMQTGKKKLVLDHVIVQKMDDEQDPNELQSILTFGAKALFDEDEGGGNRDITYSDNDIEMLIEKVETDEGEKEAVETSNTAFSFAKVWSAQKDELDEFPDEDEGDAQGDSWAQTLQKIAAVQSRVEAQEAAGRGVRRKAALAKRNYAEVSPDKIDPKRKKKQKSSASSGSDDEYNLPQTREGSEVSSTEMSTSELALEQIKSTVNLDGSASKLKHESHRRANQHLSTITHRGRVEYCGLCSTLHGPGVCPMTANPKNLVEYRRLLVYSEDEPYEDLDKAVKAIDGVLSAKGMLYLIAGQPLGPQRKRHASSTVSTTQANLAEGSSQRSRTLSKLPVSSIQEPWQVVGWGEPTHFVTESDSSAVQAPTTAILSKRSSSSAPETSVKKTKIRTCDICTQPYHLPVHCPVVAKGPESVLKAIARLTNEQGNAGTLTALRGILRKQRRALEQPSQRDAVH